MTRWLVRPRPNPGAALRLVCLPYAGGGASTFRSWPSSLPPEIEVCAVELPGRETRFAERPFQRMSALVEDLAPVLLPIFDRPVAIYGHSLGALLGLHVIRALRRGGHPVPRHFFAAAHRAPHLREPLPLWELPDPDLIVELRRMEGIPDLILQEPELMARLLPIIRADISVAEAEPFTEEPPVDCPITALGGHGDPRVSPDRLEAWGLHTTRAFDLELFPGGHFFVQKAAAPLLASLSRRLRAILDQLV